MDPVRFDLFTRSLSPFLTRRRTLGILAVLPLGGGLSGLPGSRADAKRRRRTRRTNGEIVGGRPVAQGALPFLVYYDNSSYACGGSLVGPRTVLTAAHCTGPNEGKGPLFPAGEYYVGIGQVDRLRLGTQNSFGVSSVVRHPKWNPAIGSTVAYDVAILQLDRPVPANIGTPVPFVGPGDTRFDGAGQAVRVAGWGLTSTGGTPSDVLLEVDVNVIGNQQCIAVYGAGPEGIDPISEICAGAPGRDSCQGDSGGPLFVAEFAGTQTVKEKGKKRKGKKRKVKTRQVDVYTYTQTGIVSFGRECADPVFPGVYARISDPAISNFVAGQL